MAEYISREAMVKNLTADLEHHSGEGDPRTHLVIQRFIKYVEDFPSSDVQPVKHGRWIPQSDDMWLCSNCKENIIYSCHESDRTEKQRYCCRCGARMIKDGDAE